MIGLWLIDPCGLGHTKARRKNSWAVQEQLNGLEEEKRFGLDSKMIFFGENFIH
jgi:hypothetical protein